MPPTDSDILTELRIAVARIETRIDERFNAVDNKFEQAMVSREHLEQRLAPLTANMNRWKGALVVITFVAGSLGAVVATAIKNAFGASP